MTSFRSPAWPRSGRRFPFRRDTDHGIQGTRSHTSVDSIRLPAHGSSPIRHSNCALQFGKFGFHSPFSLPTNVNFQTWSGRTTAVSAVKLVRRINDHRAHRRRAYWGTKHTELIHDMATRCPYRTSIRRARAICFVWRGRCFIVPAIGIGCEAGAPGGMAVLDVAGSWSRRRQMLVSGDAYNGSQPWR
jgi:hypothetical protein